MHGSTTHYRPLRCMLRCMYFHVEGGSVLPVLCAREHRCIMYKEESVGIENNVSGLWQELVYKKSGGVHTKPCRPKAKPNPFVLTVDH